MHEATTTTRPYLLRYWVVPSDARVRLPREGVALDMAVKLVEGELIGQALYRTHGNHAAAARLLGIKRSTLVEKVKRYRANGIMPP